MGEMHLKGNIQLVIIRPTIITSPYKEPFPGWMEGVKRVDSFILAYGKGVSHFIYGDPNSKIDVIPGDMGVNSILAAIIAHTGKDQYSSSQEFIYHITSSKRNPPKPSDIALFLFHYFTQNQRRWEYNQIEWANVLSWNRFDKTYKDLKRKIDMAIRLSELYKPSMEGRLRMTMKEYSMDDELNFDPNCIKWEDYFMKTHLPGAVKHIF
ncbi:unnamed protein product [Withania somnifera]